MKCGIGCHDAPGYIYLQSWDNSVVHCTVKRTVQSGLKVGMVILGMIQIHILWITVFSKDNPQRTTVFSQYKLSLIVR